MSLIDFFVTNDLQTKSISIQKSVQVLGHNI